VVVVVVVVVAGQNGRKNGNFVRTNGHLGGTLSVDLSLLRALRVRKENCCFNRRLYAVVHTDTTKYLSLRPF